MNDRSSAGQSANPTLLIEHIPFDTDLGIASRARIGLLVLATDFTIEHEWRAMLAGLTGVALYQSRILNDNQITPETLRAMEPRIAAATDVILPGTELDVVAYGCTSASMAIGEEKVFERIRSVRPQVKCTTPITAAFAAFHALKARRIGVLTPYRADVNRIVADYIAARGFIVPVFGSFNEADDGKVARITPGSVRRGVQTILAQSPVDAVFVSCTSVRLAEAARAIETETGVPITSSNHAMAWHALRLAGVNDVLPQWGRLFETQTA
ncbi:Asp/Glu racemase [Aestuariivirga sp.]|jgi:maleate isomerase|uniref:aspartate racemase/maleate isomerase family protein n=1 Tax=Aestuariivirga sp. TaxID=2650926 RepID=UPI0037832835